ncbi:hypothetical protein CSOJ01_15191 [Colletotrichum sojae]|uniref:Uncharacterized protein n=1 Tax=Colletotrichum sojae TaxID=2175907 RepID=A0A8H6IN61_9PEZI|nr:hypothetical protein CSOJ01_15191 [Colletotrichum sojae]
MMCLPTIAAECTEDVRTLRGGKTTISVSSEVWAHSVIFEGRQYLSSLSNAPDDYHDARVFAPNPESRVMALHLREDYLGVREVVFRYQCPENGDSSVAACQDSWWRIGLKLRCIPLEDGKESLDPLQRILFSVPSPALRMTSLKVSPPVGRMTAMPINDPRVTAYSTHWSSRIMFSKQPLEVMSLKHNQFRTDKGRSVVFGSDSRTQTKSDAFLLDLPCREEASQIFLEESPRGVRNVAFESASPKLNLTLVPTPHGLIRVPMSTPWKPIFFSGASLAGLSEVVPCKGHVGPLDAIIGLLLRYSDGREASLGQGRIAWMLP